jgi:hypothetical protein
MCNPCDFLQLYGLPWSFTGIVVFTYYLFIGHETDHSPPTSARVKKTWICTCTLHTPSWLSAQVVKHRDNFTFTLFEIISIHLKGGGMHPVAL